MLHKFDYLRLFFVLAIWRVLLLVLIPVSAMFFELRPSFLATGPGEFMRNQIIWAHASFDGDHYINISQVGYGFAEQAFFPLYPTLIKKLTPFLRNSHVIAGLVISNVCFVLSSVLLLKLMNLDHNRNKSGAPLLVLGTILIFPTSFFFVSVYTESLFFLLLIASFLAARSGNWKIAALIGALATATRFVGIFLLPALLAEFRQSKHQKSTTDLLALLLIPVGLILFMIFLNKSFGDPLAFIHVQKHFGQFRSEKIILLYQVFWRYLKMLFTVNRSDPLFWTVTLEAITGVVFLITTIYSFLKLRLSYAIFNLTCYLVPTLTGSFVSLPRYVLVAFPSFMLLARFVGRSKIIFFLYFSISLGGLFYFWMKFARGYWVG